MFRTAMTVGGFDPELDAAINGERKRQEDHIELIASENYASPRVLEAQGSVLTNKYAEGYPGKRYYGGCEFVDIAEQLAIDRAKKLFGADYANVQPHSGQPGQRRGLSGADQSGRHHPRHEPRSRRSPDARRQGQFLGQAVPRRAVRHPPGQRRDRLRRAGRAGAGRETEDGGRRLLRLFARARFQALPRDRRLGGRLPDGRHGARRRPGRRGRRIRTRFRTPTSSPAPRTRHCAVRAVA